MGHASIALQFQQMTLNINDSAVSTGSDSKQNDCIFWSISALKIRYLVLHVMLE